MAVGFPTKVTYTNGDVYSASDVNDTNGTLNLIKPTAKGDLFAGSAANTYTKLAVGANDTVLTADSAEATGMKWAVASGWSPDYTLVNTGGTALTGANTITVSLSGKKQLMIRINGISADADYASFFLRLNSDSGSNYLSGAIRKISGLTAQNYAASTSFFVGANNTKAVTDLNVLYNVSGAGSSGVKPMWGGSFTGTADSYSAYTTTGLYVGTSAITSVSIITDTGNFDGGTIYVYAA
jgi:hypothetical protein